MSLDILETRQVNFSSNFVLLVKNESSRVRAQLVKFMNNRKLYFPLRERSKQLLGLVNKYWLALIDQDPETLSKFRKAYATKRPSLYELFKKKRKFKSEENLEVGLNEIAGSLRMIAMSESLSIERKISLSDFDKLIGLRIHKTPPTTAGNGRFELVPAEPTRPPIRIEKHASLENGEPVFALIQHFAGPESKRLR